ncbi:hypothetical protein FHY17_001312 [Xanthomonas arboricola]|uniref:hypothetical protein n=1 Tax=Xanthomonas arboricola TaxID=56448 RepID=UPI00160FC99B|nr:hypothetical protein [Xanthomonas arboricola]MBB3797084.1 hypothetical protein [Xanthomonas arboricola]
MRISILVLVPVIQARKALMALQIIMRPSNDFMALLFRQQHKIRQQAIYIAAPHNNLSHCANGLVEDCCKLPALLHCIQNFGNEWKKPKLSSEPGGAVAMAS